MGFHSRQVDHQIAVQNIRVEVQGDAVSQIHRFERPLEDVDHVDPVSSFQGIISECLEGMGLGFAIFGILGDHALPDGNVVHSAFLEQDDHIFDNPRGGDDSPFGKGHRLGPEDDVGFNENPHAGPYLVQAAAQAYRLFYRFQGGLIANNGDDR